jgi:SAM-dependent methyltransferase
VDSDEPDYLGPYLRAVASHGPGFPALLFSSRELQRKRFAVLTSALILAGRRVADLGSGHGDLLAWFDEHEIHCASYVGVEAVAAFDSIARQRVGARERVAFVRHDFVAEPELFEQLVREHGIDTMLFCGSLNTLDEPDALAVLERAWTALPRPGGVLGFNFLAGGGDWERPPTNLPRRDSARFVAWALERTPHVLFCQHYLGAHDATLIMHRPAP